MKRFAYSAAAGMSKGSSVTIRHAIGFILAISKEEAEGKGLAIIRRLLPSSEGWSGYDVIVKEIPEDMPSDPEKAVMVMG